MKKKALRKAEEFFLFFLAVSMLGWLYEVILEVFIYRWGFSNRGVLLGPYCVVYGAGSLVLLFCLSGLRRRRIYIGKVNVVPILVFCAIVLLATFVELGASYLMEWTQGDWMWDYSRFWLNFEGRIAPNPGIRFGIGGMAILYLLHPLFERLLHKCSDRHLTAISAIAAAIFLCDCLWLLR